MVYSTVENIVQYSIWQVCRTKLAWKTFFRGTNFLMLPPCSFLLSVPFSCLFFLEKNKPESRCPEAMFDLFLSYPNSSWNSGGLGGHRNLNFRGTNLLTKNGLRNFPPNFRACVLWVRKVSAKFPAIFPSPPKKEKQSPTSFCRSAGRKKQERQLRWWGSP